MKWSCKSYTYLTASHDKNLSKITFTFYNRPKFYDNIRTFNHWSYFYDVSKFDTVKQYKLLEVNMSCWIKSILKRGSKNEFYQH